MRGSASRRVRSTIRRVCLSSFLSRARASPRALRVSISSFLSCLTSAFHWVSRPAIETSLCAALFGLCNTRPRYNNPVSDAIQVSDTVRVPAGALTVRAVRASGPGGQNVNKVATKIDLRVDLDAIEGLPEPARDRLRTLARHRLDADGRLAVTSQVARNRARNLEDAREKVRALIAAALVRPRPRTATRPTVSSRQARLDTKRVRSHVKRLRARPGHDD